MKKIETIKGLEDIIPRDKIFYNEPMKKRTTMKVGGLADIFVEVENKEARVRRNKE